jgi:hypothetical protein
VRSTDASLAAPASSRIAQTLDVGQRTEFPSPAKPSDAVLDAVLDAREQALELGAVVGVEAGARRPHHGTRDDAAAVQDLRADRKPDPRQAWQQTIVTRTYFDTFARIGLSLQSREEAKAGWEHARASRPANPPSAPR